jgi:hypothetical protein
MATDAAVERAKQFYDKWLETHKCKSLFSRQKECYADFALAFAAEENKAIKEALVVRLREEAKALNGYREPRATTALHKLADELEAERKREG